MLKKLVNSYSPDWMAVVFDSKQPTSRHQLFPAYKQNRTKMPEDLAAQIQPLLEIIQALGLAVIQVPGIEADDIIGKLVLDAQNSNMFSIISTGDKDLAQLVNDDVILINTMSDTILDYHGVIDKFKVPPELIIDYLVLVGDKIDNIPGVANVGPKTALKWLTKYKNLSGVIKHNQEITGKVGDNLRSAISNVPLYKQLVTINTDIQLDYNVKDLIIKKPDYKKLKLLFTELEFNSWLKEIQSNIKESVDHNISSINNKLTDWINVLEGTDLFAIHLHTTSAGNPDAQVIGISLAINKQETIESCYFSFPEFDTLIMDNSKNQELMVLFNLLNHPNKIKVAYDLKFFAKALNNYSFDIQQPFLDVMLESYVLNSIIQINLQPHLVDAKTILSLHNEFWPKFNANYKLKEVLLNIELPLSLVLKKMEQIGVLIDAKKLEEQGLLIAKQIKDLEGKIYKLSGLMFNLNSPKQLQEILYEKLKLPALQKTPKGQYSTSEAVLQELSLEFELPGLILQYRTLSKLQTTYIIKLPKNINHKTGRIHTSYNQTVTATGRLSSSEPNLQNIPIRTVEGRSIRKAFISRSGYKILSADYSQIELRILAHLSEDPALIKAFSENKDIHSITASEIFHRSLDQVTEDERRKAKAINFGLIYGMSDFGLAKQLRISRSEAANYINTYFTKFPRVLAFMDETRKFAACNGFVETMFGRRLYLPDINSKNLLQRKAERAAINAPMQGAQADLIKMAMISINKWIEEEHQDVFMLMQIHDELIFEVPENKVDLVSRNVINIMQNVAQLKVQLKVETGFGNNWAEAH